MNKFFSIIRSFVFIIGFLISFPVLSDTEQEVKEAVMWGLENPESAKFGKFTLVTPNRACMTVTTSTPIGSFPAGEQQFYLIKKGTTWSIVSNDNFTHALCVKLMSEL